MNDIEKINSGIRGLRKLVLTGRQIDFPSSGYFWVFS